MRFGFGILHIFQLHPSLIPLLKKTTRYYPLTETDKESQKRIRARALEHKLKLENLERNSPIGRLTAPFSKKLRR